MSHQDSRFVPKQAMRSEQLKSNMESLGLWNKYLLDDMLPDVTVYGTQRIIQEVDVAVLIHSSRQRYASLLPARKVNSLQGPVPE